MRAPLATARHLMAARKHRQACSPPKQAVTRRMKVDLPQPESAARPAIMPSCRHSTGDSMRQRPNHRQLCVRHSPAPSLPVSS